VIVTVSSSDGKETEFTAVCRLDNDEELKYYRHGGILQTVMLDYLEK
jgi:aconitate hydratase